MAPFPFWDGYFHGVHHGPKSERQDHHLGRKIGWGGRIRTFTVLINSEVSYQLDHAPAGLQVRSGEGRSLQAGPAVR